MIRLFVNWELWECHKNGMYRTELNDDIFIKDAIKFMSNTELFAKSMTEVVEKWTYTMIHHLSNSSLNKRAFVGQCACSYALNCPESIVRIAWKHLTEKQRNDADIQAERVIKNYLKNK